MNSTNPSPASEQRMRGFCPTPGCDQRVEIVSFRDPGGVNDLGVIVAQCNACGNDLAIDIVNPADARLSGAGNQRTGDPSDESLSYWRDNMLLQIEPGDTPVHDAQSCNLFRCDACHTPVESIIQQAIHDKLVPLNDELYKLHQHYLKSEFSEPAFTVVRGEARCSCGASLAYKAFRLFKPAQPIIEVVGELLIAAVEGAETFAEIDGVFTRDECEALVTKLMYRWQLLYPSTVIATPFVGFSFGAKQKFCDIWDRLLALIDPNSVTLVTRKRAVTEFRKATEEQDKVELFVLERYGLLHPALTHFVKENRFHAKFYAAVCEVDDKVEALIGSFNFQEGVALENMTLRTYSSSEFRRRYLDKLGVPKTPAARSAPFCAIVDVGGTAAIARAGRLSETPSRSR